MRQCSSRLITGFVTILTRRVPLVEQELLTLPEHLSSPPIFSGVRVTRSLVSYVCFVDHCLSFCAFSFCYCVVCSSSIYGFWLVSSNSSSSHGFITFITNSTGVVMMVLFIIFEANSILFARNFFFQIDTKNALFHKMAVIINVNYQLSAQLKLV